MIKINEKIRIVRHDKLNLTLEVLEEVTNPKTNETRKEWKWHGYYGNLKSAIGGVLKHCLFLLVDEEINDLKQLSERIDDIEKQLGEVEK